MYKKALKIKLLVAQILVASIIILIVSQFFWSDTNKVLTAIALILILLGDIIMVKSVLAEARNRERLSDFLYFSDHKVKDAFTPLFKDLNVVLSKEGNSVPPKTRDILKKMEINNQNMKSAIDVFLNENKDLYQPEFKGKK